MSESFPNYDYWNTCSFWTTGIFFGNTITVSRFLYALPPPQTHIMLLGDFNAIHTAQLDRSRLTWSLTFPKTLLFFLEHYITDCWCSFHPYERDYTYFSSCYNSCSRLDFIFVIKIILQEIQYANIKQSFSDQVSVQVKWKETVKDLRGSQWWLNIFHCLGRRIRYV